MHVLHDELEVVYAEKMDVIVVCELSEADELKLDTELLETKELTNSTDEIEVVLTDTDEEVDGGDEMLVYEMVLVMTIKELEDEVDM